MVAWKASPRVSTTVADEASRRVMVSSRRVMASVATWMRWWSMGFVEEERVTRCDGLHLPVGQGGVADVLHDAGVEAAAHDLVDEPGFTFHGLPGVGVEAALDE